MICYKDKAFCASECTNRACDRHQSQLPEKPPLPVQWMDFSRECDKYQPEISDD